MKLLLSTFVAALLTLEASAKFRSRSVTQVGHSLKQDGRSLRQDGRSLVTVMSLNDCSDFALMAGSTATCAGALACNINNGQLGVSPGTSLTGNFHDTSLTTTASSACAASGLIAWSAGKQQSGTVILAEMGGMTFIPGVYTHGSAINIGLPSPIVTLDAGGDTNAEFIFVAGTALTTCANSKIELTNGAKAENVYWVLGTALTMGAGSVVVGNVLAGSAITIGTNGKICGRAIAQTAVTCATGCTVEIPVGNTASTCSQYFETAVATPVPTPTTCACVTPTMSPVTLSPIAVVPAVTVLGAALGGNTLTPGYYSVPAAATLTGILTLDAQGAPGAEFHINIGGAFSTAAASQIVLINGPATVIFHAVGAITTGAASVVIGTLKSDAAITTGATSLCDKLDAGGAITTGAGSTCSGDLTSDAAITMGAGASALSATTNAAVTKGAGAFFTANIQSSASILPAELGGHSLAAGEYTAVAAVGLTGTLNLQGVGNFIFNVPGALTTAAGSTMNVNGATSVEWIVGGAITTGANSIAKGNMIAVGAITTGAGATTDDLESTGGAVTLGAGAVSADVEAVGAITLGALANVNSYTGAITFGAGATSTTNP